MSADPAPTPPERATLVLHATSAAEPVDARELLDRARVAGPGLTVELRPADLEDVLLAALDLDRRSVECGEGRGAALEWDGERWRLVSLGARDPLHGAGADEGIGPPLAGDGPGARS